MNKTRNSSIELLRILSMLFIVCSHFCVHGSFETNDMSFSANKIILQIGVLGNLGVVVFVMISGYFLSQSQFKAMRIIKILLQVLFYSCMIYFVLVALNLIHFSVIEALKALFPILFKQYWFATAYVILYVLSPFLNMLLNSFSFKQFVAFLSVCVCVCGAFCQRLQLKIYSVTKYVSL